MKKDILEFVKGEIKSFFLFIYWVIIIAMIIEIVNRSSGFENAIIITLAYIIYKINRGNK
jgi:hypothetical protein